MTTTDQARITVTQVGEGLAHRGIRHGDAVEVDPSVAPSEGVVAYVRFPGHRGGPEHSELGELVGMWRSPSGGAREFKG